MKSLYLLLIAPYVFANAAQHSSFQSTIHPIPQHIQTKMKQNTWRQGCPLALNQLAYVELDYWGFDDKTHTGALIVNKDLADEVVAIFKVLFQHKFRIQSMKLMDEYKGDDNAAMDANNTSAFNCREVTDKPGEFSQHSYGRAIDINTLINPYVNGNKILPAQGAPYATRKKNAPGTIMQGDLVYQEFIKHGWDWGGNWYDVQDYQHFEKRANGEKRNPFIRIY